VIGLNGKVVLQRKNVEEARPIPAKIQIGWPASLLIADEERMDPFVQEDLCTRERGRPSDRAILDPYGANIITGEVEAVASGLGRQKEKAPFQYDIPPSSNQTVQLVAPLEPQLAEAHRALGRGRLGRPHDGEP